MRIRSIKPEFWSDRKVATWDDFTKLFFIGLWSFADDHGCGLADPVKISCDLYPRDMAARAPEILASVSRALATLAESGVIHIFEAEDENWYEVVNWRKHQRVDRPSKRCTPTPSAKQKADPRDTLATPSRDTRARSREQGAGSREHGAEEQGAEEQGRADAAPAPQDFSQTGHEAYLRREVVALPKTLRESPEFAAFWPEWIAHLIESDPKKRRPSAGRLTDHAKTCLEVFQASGPSAALDTLRFAIRVGKEFPIVDSRPAKSPGTAAPAVTPSTPESEAADREANLDHYLPRADWRPPALPKAITPAPRPRRAGDTAPGAHAGAGAPESETTPSA